MFPAVRSNEKDRLIFHLLLLCLLQKDTSQETNLNSTKCCDLSISDQNFIADDACKLYSFLKNEHKNTMNIAD